MFCIKLIFLIALLMYNLRKRDTDCLIKKMCGVGDEYYEFFTNVASDIYIHDYVSIDDIDSKTINTEKIYYHTVSSDVSCRADIHDIYSTTFILVLAFLFLVNIITRCIRRGGLFSL